MMIMARFIALLFTLVMTGSVQVVLTYYPACSIRCSIRSPGSR